MLVEDFLDELENALKTEDLQNLKRILKNHTRLEDPILEEESVSEKLSKLVEYLSPIPRLPESRRKRRIREGLGMLERFRSNHMVSRPDCSKPKDPSLDITYAKGVGPKRAKLLKRLGLEKLGDIVYHIPRDYEDRRRISRLTELKPGEKTTAEGKLISVEKKRVKSVNLVVAVVRDGIFQVLLKWFNQDYMYDVLKGLIGKNVFITGTVKEGYYGQLEFNSPEVVPVDSNFKKEILPIYRLTEGISQKTMRRIFKENMSVVCRFEDDLPEDLKIKRNLLDLREALFGIHFPKTVYHLRRSKERLAYEEFLYFQVALALSRKRQEDIGGVPKEFSGRLVEDFLKRQPFELTNAQKRVHSEIRNDLKSPKPMKRLLQGDVGSGKTVVAMMALLDNVEAGFQGAMMAPTTILAIQHFSRILEDFTELGLKVGLLTGSTPNAEKRKIKSMLASGSMDVVVGTHALIQEDVTFSNLGLVVIDEQHRFGVRQREALMSKGKLVDTLVMTATPIPRTLSLTLYGDLDVSILDEMPPGRKPVRTLAVPISKVREVYEFVREEVERGHQAFIVYPLIEESEKLALKAATDMFEYLSRKVFPDLRLVLLHGKMSDSVKGRIMEEFARGEHDVLVSTTVVEVGIDVPNATVMVIENPERFGLAQLHQLRGRVGRSRHQAYCFLVYGDIDEEAFERLKFFESTTDGFKIAEYDLRMRGPGEFLGTRQHGLPDFRFGDLVKDRDLLMRARRDAFEMLENDPDMVKYSEVYTKVGNLYGERIKLLEVG